MKIWTNDTKGHCFYSTLFQGILASAIKKYVSYIKIRKNVIVVLHGWYVVN